jgi:hypothetical protein
MQLRHYLGRTNLKFRRQAATLAAYTAVASYYMLLLPIILLQEYLAICRCNHSKQSSSANNLSDSWTSLLFFSRDFFCKMTDSTFSISSTDLITSICSWRVLFTSGLFSGLICSFRKDILSSITCCRVNIIYLVKPSFRWMVITWLALKGERGETHTQTKHSLT